MKIKIIIIVLAALLALGFAKNIIVQSVISGVVSKAAHVPVSIGSTSASFIFSSIDIRGFRLHNPKGFPERMMLDISRIFIDFDPAPLLKGQAHFEEVKLNLKELVVIKNREGLLNVDAVKPTQEQKHESEAARKSKEPPKLKIDKLYLSIGRVVYKDYSLGGEPRVEVFDVNIQDRVFTNIEDPNTVVSVVMFEALTRTTLSRLASLDLGSFKAGGMDVGDLSGFVDKGSDSVEGAAKGILSLFQ